MIANSPPALFLAFPTAYDDGSFGEHVPVAAVVRIDASMFERVDQIVRSIRSGDLSTAVVPMDPLSISWIKKVGILSDNSLAPIPGVTQGSDVILTQPDMLDRDLDESLDFQGQCDIYRGGMRDCGLEITMVRGDLMVVPVGTTYGHDHDRPFRFAGIYASWSPIEVVACAALREQPPQAPEPVQPLLVDATDKAEILEALVHYRRTSASARVAGAVDRLSGLIDRFRAIQPDAADDPGLNDAPRAYFETILQVKVLSEDTPAEGMSLEAIFEAITDGDCVGEVAHVTSRQISAQTAVRRLTEMGSEPGFFRLDDNGLHEDDGVANLARHSDVG